MPQCKAKSKRSGKRCKNNTSAGKVVCHIHGGKTPVGIASPNYKTGRYSKYLPSRLAGRYQEAVNDPGLLELNHEIALMDARLTSLLERVETGETASLWEDVSRAWAELTAAIREQNKVKQQETAVKLDALIRSGQDDYEAWHEIQDTIEQRRKLVESERKRLVEAQQHVTTVQAMTLIGNILAIIKNNVTDAKTLQAISADVGQLVSRPDVIDVG